MKEQGTKKLALVQVVCGGCRHKTMVKPQEIPKPCPSCNKNMMWPVRNWGEAK